MSRGEALLKNQLAIGASRSSLQLRIPTLRCGTTLRPPRDQPSAAAAYRRRQKRPQLFAGAAELQYMARRGSSGLHSWPRMMPCSSPLSFDSAIAARRGLD
jgi:hypothetical protein